jgi:hypothetical protein
MECQCHYEHIFKTFAQRCALSLSGEESFPLLEYLLNLPCLACNKNRKKRHTKRRKKGRKEKGEKKREKRKGRKEKGEKKREKRKGRKKRKIIPNAVCEECFTIPNIPKDKKYMGTLCQ